MTEGLALDGGQPIRLFLVRHAESLWNAEGRLQGQSPEAPGLSPAGHAQAAQLAASLAGSGIERVISSDLLRAVETAGPIARALGVEVELEPRLRERSLGLAEGRLASARSLVEAGSDADGTIDPDRAPEGGESLRQLYRRLSGLLEELRSTSSAQVLLVSHGWTLRAILGYLSGAGAGALRWGGMANATVNEVLLHRVATPVTGSP